MHFESLQVCLNGLKAAMSFFAESEAVFKDRVASAGLSGDILKSLSDAGYPETRCKPFRTCIIQTSLTRGLFVGDCGNETTA